MMGSVAASRIDDTLTLHPRLVFAFDRPTVGTRMYDRVRAARLRAIAGSACIRVATVAGAILGATHLDAQPLTRAQAIEVALSRGPRLSALRADTVAAFAQLVTARALPNPTLGATYTKDPPQYHIIAGLPLDFGIGRSARVRAAESARVASSLRFRYDRALLTYDADTTYTRALAAQAHALLSRRNAQDADSLRRIAELRRDAGDASELDVQLAIVNAGQQTNAAIADSLTLLTSLLELQTVLGMPATAPVVTLSDSLAAPPNEGLFPASGQQPLRVAAAEATLASAEFNRRVQQRSVWTLPSIEGGVEFGEPAESKRTLLPTFGLSFPLPFLNRNRGPILAADAERDRARAELELARLESQSLITRALRERDLSLGKVVRDRMLVESANRVVVMSIRSYQEGAAPLANVLEAQRTAREVFGQYIDDVAAAWIARSAVRLYTLTSISNP